MRQIFEINSRFVAKHKKPIVIENNTPAVMPIAVALPPSAPPVEVLAKKSPSPPPHKSSPPQADSDHDSQRSYNKSWFLWIFLVQKNYSGASSKAGSEHASVKHEHEHDGSHKSSSRSSSASSSSGSGSGSESGSGSKSSHHSGIIGCTGICFVP